MCVWRSSTGRRVAPLKMTLALLLFLAIRSGEQVRAPCLVLPTLTHAAPMPWHGASHPSGCRGRPIQGVHCSKRNQQPRPVAQPTPRNTHLHIHVCSSSSFTPLPAAGHNRKMQALINRPQPSAFRCRTAGNTSICHGRRFISVPITFPRQSLAARASPSDADPAAPPSSSQHEEVMHGAFGLPSPFSCLRHGRSVMPWTLWHAMRRM